MLFISRKYLNQEDAGQNVEGEIITISCILSQRGTLWFQHRATSNSSWSGLRALEPRARVVPNLHRSFQTCMGRSKLAWVVRCLHSPRSTKRASDARSHKPRGRDDAALPPPSENKAFLAISAAAENSTSRYALRASYLPQTAF